MNCHAPEEVQQRILEHELIHYKLWMDREKDWGHSERFRRLAFEAFGHQSITHGIGTEPD
jgi:predicted SprT family Zn-dependent metalloprotease